MSLWEEPEVKGEISGKMILTVSDRIPRTMGGRHHTWWVREKETWWTDKGEGVSTYRARNLPGALECADPSWVVDILSTTGQTALSHRVHRVILETVNESPDQYSLKVTG